jgi:hypothetical protein
MATTIAQTMNNELAKIMQGYVYEHIWVTGMGADLFVHKDYYMVKGGIVYLINNGKMQPSEDSLMTLQTDGRRFERYKEGKIYKSRTVRTTYAEFKRKLKL